MRILASISNVAVYNEGMKLIDTIYERDLRETEEPTDRSDYYHRHAARAVLLDEQGRVFLMHVGLHGYHKLPGGGIKEDEEIEQALARELQALHQLCHRAGLGLMLDFTVDL